MYALNTDLKISDAVYNAEKFSSIKTLAQLRELQPDTINSMITYAYGSEQKYKEVNFPLMFYTQGMGRKRAVKSIDGTFQARMYGNPKKTSRIARTITYLDNKPGLDGVQTFTIVFEDKWFMKGQMLYTGMYGGIQVRVETDPIKDPKGGYMFTVRMQGAKKGSYVPVSALAKGTTWSGGIVKVSLLRSKGTEHRSMTYYRIQNSIGAYRHSFNWAGNVANKVMTYAIKINGKTINVWTEWEKAMEEMSFQEKKEVDFIFSKLNKDAEGNIQTIDIDSNETVPSGMGIWDQITQSLEYGVMTETKWDNFITDIIYNSGDQNASGERVIMGGTGLMMEIDRAFKHRAGAFQMISNDLYVKGDANSKEGLQYGSYFTSYRHRSGVIFKFVKHQAFDTSSIAQSAPKHPKYRNLSTMSFCGLALDFATVEVDKKLTGQGQESNIMYLYEEGREFDEWMVQGGAKIPGVQMQESRATDQDQSSWHMFATQGAHVNYPSLCAKILYK